MFSFRYFSLLVGVIFFSQHAAAQQISSITITNPSDLARPDELVVVSKAILKKKAGTLIRGKYISLTGRDGLPLTVQFDDMDGDGDWDEAAFLYSFQPKERAVLKFTVTSYLTTDGKLRRAHVRLRKKNPNNNYFARSSSREVMPFRNQPTDLTKQPLPPYLTEGPAWENDKVAFRLYFDVRNNKDIYGKTTPRMVLDEVGTDPKVSYHDISEWGMDVLHVVKSLGAGALALQFNADGKDTLMRLGGTNVTQTIYDEVSDGPVRAICRMNYTWTVAGRPVKITEEISIWGGQYFYESKVTVNGAPADAKLITGIADFYENTAQNFSEGECQVLLSHGKQSENKDYLGLGIIVPKASFASVGVAVHANSEILDTYTIAQHIKADQPCIFRFYAGWEKTDSQFATPWNFKKMLSVEALKWTKPVQVK